MKSSIKPQKLRNLRTDLGHKSWTDALCTIYGLGFMCVGHTFFIKHYKILLEMPLMHFTIVRLTATLMFIDWSLPLHNCSAITTGFFIIIVQVGNLEAEGIRSEVSKLLWRCAHSSWAKASWATKSLRCPLPSTWVYSPNSNPCTHF